jgi:HEAT repeat protein
MKLLASATDDFRFFKVLKQARQSLIELPVEARRYLVPYLSHPNPWLRRYAGTALAVHMDDEVLDLLLKGIRTNDPDVCSWYASEIAKSPHPRALPSLEAFISGMHPSAREGIFRRIRESQPDGGVDLLLLGIRQEDSLDSLRERVMALAAYNRLNQITELYDQFSAEQKTWIMRALSSLEEDLDIPGRQAIIGRLLLEGDDELVWDTFQKIGPPDLADATLRPVLERLLSHTNHRIKSRAEDYIEVIDWSTKHKKPN